MSRRRVRVTAVGSVLVVAAVAGCEVHSAALATNDLDRARAGRVWSDAWVAPTTRLTPGPAHDTDNGVVRVAGIRTTDDAAATPLQAATKELTAAAAAGWVLTYAVCPSAVPVPASGIPFELRSFAVYLELRHAATDLDHQALATVAVTSSGGVGTTSSGAGAAPGVTVRVTASVPDHADTAWPSWQALTSATTCLSGATTPVATGTRLVLGFGLLH